jgi:hypothetical protein
MVLRSEETVRILGFVAGAGDGEGRREQSLPDQGFGRGGILRLGPTPPRPSPCQGRECPGKGGLQGESALHKQSQRPASSSTTNFPAVLTAATSTESNRPVQPAGAGRRPGRGARPSARPSPGFRPTTTGRRSARRRGGSASVRRCRTSRWERPLPAARRGCFDTGQRSSRRSRTRRRSEKPICAVSARSSADSRLARNSALRRRISALSAGDHAAISAPPAALRSGRCHAVSRSAIQRPALASSRITPDSTAHSRPCE